MGKRGPAPTPTAQKLLKGTRKDRINSAEPKPKETTPDIPEELDDIGRKEWERFTPILQSMRVLTEADGPALTLYCSTYSQWVQASKRLTQQGLLITTAAGGFKLNPLANVVAQCRVMMLKCLAEFGCTPSSRSRITVPDEPKADALSAFLDSKA